MHLHRITHQNIALERAVLGVQNVLGDRARAKRLLGTLGEVTAYKELCTSLLRRKTLTGRKLKKLLRCT